MTSEIFSKPLNRFKLLATLGVCLVLLQGTKAWASEPKPGHVRSKVLLDESLKPLMENKSSLDFKSADLHLVLFWASWCGNCKMYMAELSRLGERLQDCDVQTSYISTDDKQSLATDYLKTVKLFGNQYLDSEGSLRRQIDLSRVPALFIIDKNGLVLQRRIGNDEVATGIKRMGAYSKGGRCAPKQ